MRTAIKISLVASLFALQAGSDASAGNRARPFGGTGDDPSAAKLRNTANRSVLRQSVAPITPFYSAVGNYASAGVGLRNRPWGVINLSGLSSNQPLAAFLYWAVIVATPTDPAGVQTIRLRKIEDAIIRPGDGEMVRGTLIATSTSPCWDGDHISVYRAPVPLPVVTGNGEYRVVIPPTGRGDTSGSDPWQNADVYPMWEGASLVVIQRPSPGDGNVSIYDGPALSQTFKGEFSYTLRRDRDSSGIPVQWDTIGADGQIGLDRYEISDNKFTKINEQIISGKGAITSLTSDWQGVSGTPLPQLWDNLGHELRKGTSWDVRQTPDWVNGYLNVTYSSGGDCVTPVANILRY